MGTRGRGRRPSSRTIGALAVGAGLALSTEGKRKNERETARVGDQDHVAVAAPAVGSPLGTRYSRRATKPSPATGPDEDTTRSTNIAARLSAGVFEAFASIRRFAQEAASAAGRTEYDARSLALALEADDARRRREGVRPCRRWRRARRASPGRRHGSRPRGRIGRRILRPAFGMAVPAVLRCRTISGLPPLQLLGSRRAGRGPLLGRGLFWCPWPWPARPSRPWLGMSRGRFLGLGRLGRGRRGGGRGVLPDGVLAAAAAPIWTGGRVSVRVQGQLPGQDSRRPRVLRYCFLRLERRGFCGPWCWSRTSPRTRARRRTGVPIRVSLSSSIKIPARNENCAPGSASSCSTSRTSPAWTRYRFPPVRMIAAIADFPFGSMDFRLKRKPIFSICGRLCQRPDPRP